jgi:hypothetical protein
MSRPPQLCLRWPRDRIELLRAAAARRGLSMSAFLSMLLADEVRSGERSCTQAPRTTQNTGSYPQSTNPVDKCPP